MTPAIVRPALQNRRFTISDRALAISYAAIITVLYFSAACYYAWIRPFWCDEVFTFLVARLPGAGSIWSALKGGMDNHPPLDYLFRHFSMKLFGTNELGDRLPSVIAFYIALACVFVLARRIHSTLAGILASSLLLASTAAPYAAEGRGYALVLSCAAISMLLWHRLAADPDAPVWLWAALSLTLAGAIWSHYYGVTLMAAFGCAAVVDWIARRRIPLKLIAALAAACILVLPVVPFARSATQYAGHFWTPPGRSPLQSFRDSVGEFEPAIGLIIAVLLCIFVRRHLPARWFKPLEAVRPQRLPASELALLIAVMASPVFIWLLGITITHAYLERYFLATIAAGAVVAGCTLAAACRRSAGLALVVTLVCLLQAPDALRRIHGGHKTRAAMTGLITELDRAAQQSAVPIVSASAEDYVEIYMYATDRLRRQVVALDDEAASIRLIHSDSVVVAMRNLKRFVPLRFEPLDSFVAANPHFRVLVPPYPPVPWSATRLRELGYRLTMPPAGAPVNLYYAER